MQKNHNCIKVNESLYIALAGVSESIGLSVFIFSHFFFFFFFNRFFPVVTILYCLHRDSFNLIKIIKLITRPIISTNFSYKW